MRRKGASSWRLEFRKTEPFGALVAAGRNGRRYRIAPCAGYSFAGRPHCILLFDRGSGMFEAAIRVAGLKKALRAARDIEADVRDREPAVEAKERGA